MRVAVTGAGGFLGMHVVRAFAAARHEVTALVRPGSATDGLRGSGVDVVEADLARPPFPASFAAGAELVVHVAALYSERAEDRDLMWRVNVEGTDAVIDACRQAGVARVVHVSTMGTCAPAAHGGPATEADRLEPGPGVSAYAASKIEGERRALAAQGVEVVVVNPTALVGPGDKPGVTGRRVLDAARGVMPYLLAGPVNHVCVAGCATGIVRAAASGRPGERYLLGGKNLAPDDFLARVAQAAGRPMARRTWVERLRRRKRLASGNLAVDDTKARRELGYVPGDLDAALAAAITDFRERGLL